MGLRGRAIGAHIGETRNRGQTEFHATARRVPRGFPRKDTCRNAPCELYLCRVGERGMRVVATAFRAWLLLACLFAAGSGHALPASHSELSSEQSPPAGRDIFAETELYCLALGIFFEGGSTGEPDIGQRHIARVITERAKADRPYWGGKTICGVVFYKRTICQFSFACLPLARRNSKGQFALAPLLRHRGRDARRAQRRTGFLDPLLHERGAFESEIRLLVPERICADREGGHA